MRKKVNVLGCGLMGSQIANLFCIMGYEVNIWNRTKIDLNNLLRQKRFLLKMLQVNDMEGSINFTKELQDLRNNITVESLVENLEIKKNIGFSKLSKILKIILFICYIDNDHG